MQKIIRKKIVTESDNHIIQQFRGIYILKKEIGFDTCLSFLAIKTFLGCGEFFMIIAVNWKDF